MILLVVYGEILNSKTKLKTAGENENFSVNCTGLPFTWDSDLTTDISDSVKPGQEVTLSCHGDSASNVGDEKVTCVGGTEYEYENLPRCETGGN